MSQKQVTLAMLRNVPDGICGTVFLQNNIPRYSARIADLRADGYTIDTLPCDHPYHHHASRQWKFALAAVSQPALF